MRKTVLVILGAFMVLALTSSCGNKEDMHDDMHDEDPQMRLESDAVGDSDRAA